MDPVEKPAPSVASNTTLADLFALLNRYGLDLRTLLLLLPAGGVFYVDEAMAKTAFYSLLYMGLFALTSHVLRRVFFPYVDLEKVTTAAVRTGTGAGLVFLGISMVICTVVLGSVLWMGH